MNAGKNRKKDLELLSEVYSEAMGYAGGRGSVNTQPGAGGTGDYDDSTGQITQRAEDQNPLENPFGESEETYEGEEESQQRRAARQLEDEGYTGGRADNKGNLIYNKGTSHARVDTDGQINGQPAQEFFRGTGTEDAEDFGSPNSNRSGWGSDAFSHPGSNETTDEDEGGIMGIDDCEDEPGKIDVVINPASAHGIRDILKNIFSKDDEDQEDDDWMDEEPPGLKYGVGSEEPEGMKHYDDAAQAHKADERENRKNLRAQNRLAKKQGFDPDENQEVQTDASPDDEDGREHHWNRKMPRHQDWLKPHHDRIRGETPEPVIPKDDDDDDEDENAAAAMRGDERENRKNLRAQNRIAKKYGFNPDENAEDTDEYDTNLFKHLDKRNTDEAEKQGFDPGLKNVRHSDEDEVDREGRYKERWGKDLDDEKDREGSSNAGEYTNVDKDEFCGPSGGAADGTYPVNTRKRAEAAKRLAHNAPDPDGIKRCADRALAKDSYYSSKGDRAMTQITESYEQVLKNGLL